MSKEIQTYSEEYIYSRPKSKIEKFFDFLKSEKINRFYYILPIVLLILPAFFIPLMLIVTPILKHLYKDIGTMPFSIPQYTGVKFDKFNKLPNKGPNGEVYYGGANGIAYFGNTEGDNKQAWFGNSKLRQHVAFLAATGSGKTFTIASIACANALLWGAGYLYADAKADLDIVRMHESLCHRMNRIDDVFCLNYIQGSRSVWDPYRGDKTTNTYNMLESGTAMQTTETMKSLMDGDKDIWAKRADSLLTALIAPAVYMRDKNMITLSVLTFMDFLTIENAGALIGNSLIPEEVKKPLAGFIKTLPGMSAQNYEEIIKGNSVKSPQVYDQWGFASMQIILVINMLAGDYGRIFGVTVGEVDLEAIVLQDRILITLLPALEASSQSVASMGRILMAARKGVMGRTLGERIEGSVKANLKQRPTNAPYPYIQILDEVGMIFSEGEGASAAQARGLGYSLWYSSQDLPAMKKLSETVAKEVMTVMGNTIIKIAGKIIDDETFEEYSKLFGEAHVWKREGTELLVSGSGMAYSSDSRGSYTEKKRLEKQKVSELTEGEMYIGAENILKRVNGPNLHPKSLTELMLNDFIPMRPYSNDEIESIKREKIYLESEFDQIVTKNKPLKEVQSPAYTQLPALGKIYSTVNTFIKNGSDAGTLSFATFTRLSLESVREHLNQSSDFLTDLAEQAKLVLEKNKSQNIASGQEEVITQNESTDTQGIDLEFEINTPQKEVNTNLQSDSAQTNREISPLQAESGKQVAKKSIADYFSSVGLDKKSIVEDMSRINALAKRADELKSEVRSGELDPTVADKLMNEPVSVSQIMNESSITDESVSKIFAKTDHPGETRPTADKKLTVYLLRSVYQEIVKSKFNK
ncbi:type IV secretory system conjugative DNA transfer family protein [Vibrio cholerae]|uniref:type IV secretory system conjugative DNA transfer family protein n=1 Tax=Vibrio cholerae TaxID=666 RepID=UPI0030197376